MELTGKTAIVTGAGQGIGRGIALVLAERGASVVLNGRTPAKLAAVKKEINAAGGQCVVAAGDVGSRSDVAGVVEAALGAFGGIDILVNNAQASTPDVSVLGVTDADLELTDIGRAVVGLVSDDFSYLTGATLMLDGGRTLIT